MKPRQTFTARRGFSIVETLLMLFALVVFSFTTFAVLKKDAFSLKVILSKFQTAPPVPAENQERGTTASRPAPKSSATASGSSAQTPKAEAPSAKAGSPATPEKPQAQ